jgi:cystathionine beta-lyase/cystathionine gamma-synthase
MLKQVQAKPIDYGYSRSANPTRTALEEALASIENRARGLAFSSGLAATDCLMRSFKAGGNYYHGRFVWRNVPHVYSNIP